MAFHVLAHHRGWAVLRAGALRARKVFSRREDAVILARIISKKEGTKLYVHRRDGVVSECWSYVR
jgi:hypothetical protein